MVAAAAWSGSGGWRIFSLALLGLGSPHTLWRKPGGECFPSPPQLQDTPRPGMALVPLRAQVRENRSLQVGWLLQKALLVPRSPTPRANCSSRPPIAPDGLGAVARSPTVLL